MKSALALAVCLAASFAASAGRAADTPPRLPRADSFLGIHFDFHAGADCTEVGKHTTRAMVENIINLVHPDYLQIDCKGHAGYSSYPTKVGTPAPGFVGEDPLRVWREVTAARGVALYLHYSGVADDQAIVHHPDWAATLADGTKHKRATSLYSPYARELLIPQLRELAGDYGADGVWVDGECWAAVPDYGPAALEAFRAGTGFTAVPRKPGEPHWFEFLDFQREAFRRYLRGYIAEVNRTHPAFQICSNWAFTDHMPEPVTAPIAFLSGDYDPENSVNSARLSARYLAHQGRPWDLMAWSFSTKAVAGQKTQKTAPQLEREAAVVLAQGGGFQAYFAQKRDGSIYDEQMPVMAEVAAFCRARQSLAHHAPSVPQIAVLLSTADQYHRNNGLFSRNLSRVKGVLQALLEDQQSVDVVGEHQLAGHFADYPLIVVPECDYLEPAFRAALVAYTQAGGHLLLVGPGSAQLFARELDVTLTGALSANTPLRLALAGADAELTARTQPVTLGTAARAFGQLLSAKSPAAPASPAASITPCGRGQIAAVYFTAGQAYAKDRPAALRDFLSSLTHELFPEPLVTVRGTHDVDVSLARRPGQLLVHLVNTSGPHATASIQETVAPLGPLEVSLRTAARPLRVTLEPGARPVPFGYRDGRVTLTVPGLDLYDIVAVQTN